MKIRLRKGIKLGYLRFVVITIAATALAAHLLMQYFIFYLGKVQLQEMHWRLAEQAAEHMAPALAPIFEEDRARSMLIKLQAFNPNSELYLLDHEGRVLLSGLPPEENAAVIGRRVDTGAIQWFLDQPRGEPQEFRFSMNPLFPGDSDPFSAAPLTIGSRPGYLYAVLESRARKSVFQRNVRLSITAAVLVAAVVIVLGVIGFGADEYFSLKRSMAEVSQVIERIAEGDHSARIDTTKSAELVNLGAKINELAQTLHETIKKLERSDRMRRELISNISHDLNTPLFSALGYLERLSERAEELTPQQQARFLKIARINLEMLQRLIEELFELSKLDSKDIQPQWEAFSLLDVITEEVLPTYNRLAEEHGVRIYAEYPEELPYAFGDGELLTRAIGNLVENAVRYNVPGGEVVVQVERRAGNLLVSVRDTGSGIPPEQLNRIFERFYRANRARQKGGGSGLGLAIVKRILELHNTEVMVESKLGSGTTFSFELSIAGGAASDEEERTGHRR